MLGLRLCTLHNLYFYNKMMEDIRTAIRNGSFEDYRREMTASMTGGAEES